jgi:antitoxin (DNA-binding transcriptional repressor) of toxin-antitoxin stability system
MTTITIQEAQAKLLELIHQLSPGDEVLITENNQPIARLSIAARATEASTTLGERDWWAALQKIEAGQKQRGFSGSASDIDRDDQGYDDRMNEIYKNTMPRNGSS